MYCTHDPRDLPQGSLTKRLTGRGKSNQQSLSILADIDRDITFANVLHIISYPTLTTYDYSISRLF